MTIPRLALIVVLAAVTAASGEAQAGKKIFIAVAQVKAVATGAETVTTKRAINLRAVELRPIADVHRDIESAAAKAVAAAQSIPPQREAAYKVEVQFREPFIPGVAEVVPGFQRTTPHTVAFTSDTMPKAYALIRFLYRYINPD